jgi:hypothetical protein
MWKRIESSPGATGGHSARLAERAQVADVVLQLVEQAAPAVGREQVDALADVHEVLQVAGAGGVAVVLVEQADEVAPLLAPGGQQRVGEEVQVLLGDLGAAPPRRCWREWVARSSSLSATMSAQ